MWAARERRFEELAEDEPEEAAPEHAVEPAQPPADARRGRLGRVVLLLAVVGVEGAWLAFLLYGAWLLVNYLA